MSASSNKMEGIETIFEEILSTAATKLTKILSFSSTSRRVSTNPFSGFDLHLWRFILPLLFFSVVAVGRSNVYPKIECQHAFQKYRRWTTPISPSFVFLALFITEMTLFWMISVEILETTATHISFTFSTLLTLVFILNRKHRPQYLHNNQLVVGKIISIINRMYFPHDLCVWWDEIEWRVTTWNFVLAHKDWKKEEIKWKWKWKRNKLKTKLKRNSFMKIKHRNE